MENEPNEGKEKSNVSKADAGSGAEPTNSLEGKVEESAKDLSAQEKASAKGDKEENDDPGNVARMTAKGALSGF